MAKKMNSQIAIFVAAMTLFIWMPIAWAEIAPKDITYFVADRNVALNGRTPLILVHGINRDKSDWDPFKSYFYSRSDLDSKYKLYFFTYLSNYISVDQIGEGFRWWIDFFTNSGSLEDVPFMILAHSMGGLVSRAFMLKELEQGNWAGKFGGDRVIKLITLATPHHGTPGASRCCRDRLKTDLSWLFLLEAMDIAYWTKLHDIILPQVPNRSDLRWDNWDGSMTAVGYYDSYCSVFDNNEWLNSLNNLIAYDNKIIAYAGYVDPNNPERIALVLSGPSDVASAALEAKEANDERLMSICVSIALKEGLQSIYGDNDGMVPYDSASFAGHDAVQQRGPFNGFDHGEMKGDELEPNTDGRYELLFNTIYLDLLNNCVSIDAQPSGGRAPLEIRFSTPDMGYSYSWEIEDFHDPRTIQGAEASHVFRHDGAYTINLSVNDGSGVYTYQKRVVIGKPDIETKYPDGFFSLTRKFSTRQSDLIAEYTWDFGDGSPRVAGPTQEHTYAASGRYMVFLYLTLDDGTILETQEWNWVGPGTRYIPSHTIFGQETWHGEGTYVIEGPIFVAEGGELTVERGAEVRVGNGAAISVYGTLNASGATFTRADGESEWEGIYFAGDGANGSRLDGCLIEHVSEYNYSTAIYVSNSSPTITGCTIENSRSHYGINVNGGSPDINANTISSFGTGINVWKGSPTITNNTIGGMTSTGINVSGDASPEVTGNTLSNNPTGISVWLSSNTPVFKGNTYSGNTYGDLVGSGTIANNLKWDSTLDVLMFSRLGVSEGASLTIESGTTVKGLSGSSLSVNGTLTATGATFTRADGESEWEGISFAGDVSSGSRLDGCLIEHVSEYNYSTAIYVSNSSPTITGCTIENSRSSFGIYVNGGSPDINANAISNFGTGINVWKGSPTITNNTIGGMTSTGINVSGDASPEVTGNTLSNNPTGISVWLSSNTPVFKGNTYSGNTYGDLVGSGTIANNLKWDSTLDVLMFSRLGVSEGASLTIESGTTVKGLSGSSLSVNGTLTATGATFTRADGESEWEGIYFAGDGSSGSRLDGCLIEHVSEYNYSTAIYVSNSSPTIAGCTIENSRSHYGIYVNGGSPDINANKISGLGTGINVSEGSPTIINNTIGGMTSTGINVYFNASPEVTGNTLTNNQTGIYSSSTAGFKVSACIISGNSSYGIYNSSSVPIEGINNNWGHISGPLDSSDDRATNGLFNPNGQGDKVSDNVVYYPWSGTTIGVTATPTGFSATGGDGLIDLKWNANTEADLGGYKIYCGTSSGSYDTPILMGKETSYRLTGLTNDRTYYIAISSMNTVGVESGKSAEVAQKPIADQDAPTSIITHPQNGERISGPNYTIVGSADDGEGAGVKMVEVSTDGGTTWTAASVVTPNAPSGEPETRGMEWNYEWAVPDPGPYTIKSRATDNAGNRETPGAGVTVTVFEEKAPTATTDAAASVTSSGAKLNGKVNPNGAESEVFFEWGENVSYGHTVTADQSPLSGTTAQAATAQITGLSSETTYHFRIKAVNAYGTGYGEDVSFTTTAVEDCPDCSGESPIIENETFSAGTVCECIGQKSMTIGPGVKIEKGAKVTFKAPKVDILSGVHAEEGAEVKITR